MKKAVLSLPRVGVGGALPGKGPLDQFQLLPDRMQPGD